MEINKDEIIKLVSQIDKSTPSVCIFNIDINQYSKYSRKEVLDLIHDSFENTAADALIISGDFSLETIDEKEMNALGWYKKED